VKETYDRWASRTRFRGKFIKTERKVFDASSFEESLNVLTGSSKRGNNVLILLLCPSCRLRWSIRGSIGKWSWNHEREDHGIVREKGEIVVFSNDECLMKSHNTQHWGDLIHYSFLCFKYWTFAASTWSSTTEIPALFLFRRPSTYRIALWVKSICNALANLSRLTIGLRGEKGSLYDDDKVPDSRTDTLLDIVRGTRTKEDEKSNIENTWIYKRAIGSFFFSCRAGLMCISHLRNGFEFDSFKRAMFAKKT
jgi:hypothetical protein